MSSTARWRPNRAGIRNIWEYDDQVFELAGGRLILRGPNGSGKSNALALLFPFLLDATMSAARMDPFGGGRSMKSLLLGARQDDTGGNGHRFRHDARTGYVWIEYERPHDASKTSDNGADGDRPPASPGHRYLVVGAGARATQQRDADAWFFVTDLRPGVDLDLAPDDVPLSHRALAERLGDRGTVFSTAESYRDAVDRALFGIGPDRYRNLVELVLVLRRPHLAGKLNLEHLSKVLSDGLPALDRTLVEDVAASFEDLEAVQNDLRRLQEAHRVVGAFLDPYRHYLRTVAAGRAVVLVEAAREVRRAGSALDAATAERERLAGELTEVESAIRQNAVGAAESEARRRALLESPAYRDATSLADLTRHAADSAAETVSAASRLDDALRSAADADAEVAVEQTRHDESDAVARRAFLEAAEAADRSGIAWTVRYDPEAEPARLMPTLRAPAVERREDLRVVRSALHRRDETARASTVASAAASRSAERFEIAQAATDSAAEAVNAARSAYRAALAAWAATHRDLLAEGDEDALAASVETLGEVGAAEPGAALASRWIARREALAARLARAEDRRRTLADEFGTLRAERARVAEEADPGPDRLPFRQADRSGRPGAPFFACCDFAPSLTPAERAGVEAALEAAGLLDAWVSPDGVVEPDADDAWLLVAGPDRHDEEVSRGAGRAVDTLDSLMVATPPDGCGVTTSAVERALRAISIGAGEVSVSPGGAFTLGVLSGFHKKPAAEFIGATARAERRGRRLAGLDRQISEIEGSIDAVAIDIEQLTAEQGRLVAAELSLPEPAAVHDARRALETARAEARAATLRSTEDEVTAADARREAVIAEEDLTAAAGARAAPKTEDGLDEAADAVRIYERCAEAIAHTLVTLADCRRNLSAAVTRADKALAAAEIRGNEHAESERRSRALAARVDALKERLGPDAEAPIRALATIEGELSRISSERDGLLDRRRGLDQELGAAGKSVEQAARDVETAGARRSGAERRIEVLHRSDVWAAVAGSDQTDQAAPRPEDPVALARDTVRLLADVRADEEARQEAHAALLGSYKKLIDELRHGYDPSLTEPDDVALVEVTSETGTTSVLRLARSLSEQVERQQELLTERDRQIFERHLLTRVSESLRDLLNDAGEFVGSVNDCLRDTPTASGLRIELRWELAEDDRTLRDALALLRRSPELLGPDEREQLREFFAGAIQRARSEDPGATYAAVLTRVLDYRAWHVFWPWIRGASGGVQRLTRAVFRTLSGGEQAVALHLPLFAAAAAHYRAARPDAPRLVALDEAFAGIDERMRGELMGLLVRFDLDFVMTGHELWGAYEEVPAVAVYDLLRRPPAEGVSALGMRWDGARFVDPEPVAASGFEALSGTGDDGALDLSIADREAGAEA